MENLQLYFIYSFKINIYIPFWRKKWNSLYNQSWANLFKSLKLFMFEEREREKKIWAMFDVANRADLLSVWM